MKRFFIGLLFVAEVGVCANAPKNSAVTYDYVCEKGSKKISYRIAFKTEDGLPPCKVYALYPGNKTKRIASSVKTSKVCEEVIDRLLTKLEKEGMTCFEKESEHTQ